MNTRAIHPDEELLSCYLDGELSRRQAATVEDHLEHCAGCRAELDGLRRVARSLGRLERASPPPLLAARVQRRVALTEREQGLLDRLESRLRVPRFDSPLLVMFVLVMALAVIVFLFTQQVARQQEQAGDVSIRMANPEDVEELLRTVEGLRLDGRELVHCGAGWCQVGTEEAEVEARRSASDGSPEAWYAVLLAEPEVEFVRFVDEDATVVEVVRE